MQTLAAPDVVTGGENREVQPSKAALHSARVPAYPMQVLVSRSLRSAHLHYGTGGGGSCPKLDPWAAETS
jgi:hypothetical protein